MKRKTRRFADGNVVKDITSNASDEAQARANRGESAKSESYKAAPGQQSIGLKKETFSDAFARARRNGEKTFEFGGKKYGTAMKGESKSSQGKISTTGVDAGIAAAEAQKEAKNPNSPRLNSILNVRNMANQVAYTAKQKNIRDSQEEQKRAADLLSTSTGRALLDAQAPRITKRMQDNQAYADATKKEFQNRDSMARSAYEGQGYDYDAMKKGGKVKKIAGGGMTKSASSRADGCAVRGKTRGKMY